MEHVRHRLDPRVSSVLGRLSQSPRPESASVLGNRLAEAIPRIGPTLTGDALREALAPVTWLLERAGEGALPLTQAGYLKPDAVKQLATLLPTMDDWIFPVTREVDVHPVHQFRLALMSAGLLRRYQGRLIVSRAVRPIADDPTALWQHLAAHLIPAEPAFDEDCSVIALIHLASTTSHVDVHEAATMLGSLGWAHRGGKPVVGDDVHWTINALWALLGAIGTRPAGKRSRQLSPAARAMVRDALVQYSVPV